MLEMSEHTKNMYNPAYEKGFLFGKQWWSNYERKRIIKLLEERTDDSGSVLDETGNSIADLSDLIELIKGETSD
jgi:hypothetical protein